MREMIHQTHCGRSGENHSEGIGKGEDVCEPGVEIPPGSKPFGARVGIAVEAQMPGRGAKRPG